MAALYDRACIPPLTTVLQQRRLMLLGHVLREDARHKEQNLSRNPIATVLTTPPVEPFRRGMSQLKTLIATYTDDLQALGLSISNAHTVNKTQFKREVRSI